MESTGSCHIDGLRCEIIAYAFRRKEGNELIDEFKKIRHLADEAINCLERGVCAKLR